MNIESEKHLEHCEKCRKNPDPQYRSWLCVPCDDFGNGLGCPNHACAPDPEEKNYGKTPEEKR